jgi:hypothetical protein
MLRFLAMSCAVLALTVSGCHKYGRGYSSTPFVSDPVWKQPAWMAGQPEGIWTGPPAASRDRGAQAW